MLKARVMKTRMMRMMMSKEARSIDESVLKGEATVLRQAVLLMDVCLAASPFCTAHDAEMRIRP